MPLPDGCVVGDTVEDIPTLFEFYIRYQFGMSRDAVYLPFLPYVPDSDIVVLSPCRKDEPVGGEVACQDLVGVSLDWEETFTRSQIP